MTSALSPKKRWLQETQKIVLKAIPPSSPPQRNILQKKKAMVLMLITPPQETKVHMGTQQFLQVRLEKKVQTMNIQQFLR